MTTVLLIGGVSIIFLVLGINALTRPKKYVSVPVRSYNATPEVEKKEPTATSAQILQAKQAGREARVNNQSIGLNPFDAITMYLLYKSWQDGWHSAEPTPAHSISLPESEPEPVHHAAPVVTPASSYSSSNDDSSSSNYDSSDSGSSYDSGSSFGGGGDFGGGGGGADW